MHRREMLLLIAVSAVFGASFALIRVAAPHLGPLSLAVLRVALGAPFPLAILLWRRELVMLRRQAKELLLVGAFLGAIPFTLIALAELYVDASLAAVINATTPIWGLAVAAAWLGQPIAL